MVQGRSAANSAVCYCLAITRLIRSRITLEWFPNESRKGWPDIDLIAQRRPPRSRHSENLPSLENMAP
jgi:DNA polymerase III alpha subunit